MRVVDKEGIPPRDLRTAARFGLDNIDAETSLADLVTLLIDAVNHGASVGFLAPVRHDPALDYWRSSLADVERRTVEVLVARVGGTVVGAVQLALATQPNAAHRAEVRRLLVTRSVRRRGIGRALMVAVEQTARGLARTLLVLNTRRRDPPERLYRSLGYEEVGTIPDYAHNPDGTMNTTTIMYRRL